MNTAEIAKHYAIQAISLMFDMEEKGTLFVLPFDNQGGRIAQEIRYAADSAGPILIYGPTGVGKELAVKAIHILGPRADKELISLNCANLSESVFESELFGHTKGAFTDAGEEKIGLIEQVGDGDVHLDEIGEISPRLQAKFLRLLENREYRKVGGKKIQYTKARFLITTNQPLETGESGSVRNDLIARSQDRIYMRPIAGYESRRCYVTYLIQLLAQDYLKMTGVGTLCEFSISWGAIAEAAFYEWRENVRGLKIRVEQALRRLSEGIDFTQAEFAANLKIKEPGKKSLCTFGLREVVPEMRDLPIDVYETYINMDTIIGSDVLSGILRIYIEAFQAKVNAEKKIQPLLPTRQETTSPFWRALLSYSGRQETTSPSLRALLSPIAGQSYTPAEPFNFFEECLNSAKPLDELEKRFLSYFCDHYPEKYSLTAAGKKLGRSGLGTLKRLLKKHGLEYLAKAK